MTDREKLEAGATALSSYDGNNNYDDYEGNDYVGEYDHFISAADHSSESFDSYDGLSKVYAAEVQKGRVYMLRATNLGKPGPNNTTIYQPCTFYLHSGYRVLFGQTGQLIEVNAFGISNNTATTVEGNTVRCDSIGQTGSTYTELVYFSLYNPMHVLGLKIKTNDPENLEGTIQVQPISPFRKLDNRYIYISAHKSEKDFKDNEVTVLEGFDFNNQTQISMTLSAGTAQANSYMTISLVFGAVLNTAVALARVNKGKHRRHSHGRRNRR